MKRRAFLKQGLVVSAGLVLGGFPARSVRSASVAGAAKWRSFEVVTKVEILNPSGVTRVWLPLPLMTGTDYFKRQEDKWKGNAAVARTIRENKYDAGMLYAEWPASEKTPAVELTSRFEARDRQVNFNQPDPSVKEDKTILQKYLRPTQLLPTDGIVRKTSGQITKGLKTDVDKARAIYEWIVDNTFRDPKVRGCGLGDIKTMLETRNLGGKCADLNALYVGLARAAGLPARDVYGVRVAASEAFKSLGKSGDITKAQHCRAEVYLSGYGWVPVDPADVRKVVLEENPNGLTLQDPLVEKARAKLFGAWEMNWLPFNYAHDLQLPNSAGRPVPFLMYPQGETADGRRDSLDPENFRYTMTSRELTT
ncbi:MAG: transglutaminase-like domain-containing protein [Candidatus Binatia bacterium]